MREPSQTIPCLICGTGLTLRLARGRKSGKPFLMLVCPQDGKHLRAFVAHQPYVQEVLARLEGSTEGGSADAARGPSEGLGPLLTEAEATTAEREGEP